MSSYIADLLHKVFPKSSAEGRILCVGLDGTGRTSWLYSKLLPGEHITTIPTIGFNVETVKHNGYALTIWDVGGCDKIRPLWRHYFQNTDFVVFMVDANDRERMDEVGEELRRLASEEELRDSRWLVIANKQDLPNAMSASEVSAQLRLPEVLGALPWTCLPGCRHDQAAIDAHYDWMVTVLQHPRPKPRPATAGAGSGGAAAGAGARVATAAASGGGGDSRGQEEPELLERWLRVVDEPDDEFLRKLEDFRLETWDHRTHLRLAWLYLMRLGRRQGLARIHVSIRDFIANSPVTRRKTGTTYHETMTYFWAHMVHFAIASQKLPEGATPDFRLFLLLNPQLSNGGLFLHYYTKDLMLKSPEARVTVVLPDKRPLPSIITDLASLSINQESVAPPQSAAPSGQQLADSAFLVRFLDLSLDRWNHECLLRAIYCCLKQHGRRQGGHVALEGLRALQKEGFHLTINYCWLGIITHTLVDEYNAALFAERPAAPPPPTAAAKGEATAAPAPAAAPAPPVAATKVMPEWSSLLASNNYTSVRMRELLADPHRYLQYYSKKVIYSDEAAAQFMPPDKRPLPSMA